MSRTEKFIPDWVWKRRWSSSWARKSTALLGLFVMALGAVILVAGFEAAVDLPNLGPNGACTMYANCIGPIVSTSPVHQTYVLVNYLVEPLAVALTVAGLAWAFQALRAKDPEWAAVFGLQPLARQLETLHSQGKMSTEQINEIFTTFKNTLPKT